MTLFFSGETNGASLAVFRKWHRKERREPNSLSFSYFFFAYRRWLSGLVYTSKYNLPVNKLP